MSHRPSGTDRGEVDVPSVIEAGQAVLGPAVEASIAEAETVSAIARKAAEAFVAGHRVFAVGAGHAQAFAMELCHRAGGLPVGGRNEPRGPAQDKRESMLPLNWATPSPNTTRQMVLFCWTTTRWTPATSSYCVQLRT